MTSIPDGLPTLSKGGHEEGTGFACAMEYVSVIAGERFSDTPACTHRNLASMVIGVNDILPDEDRHLLLPLIPRLVGANHRHSDHPFFEEDFIAKNSEENHKVFRRIYRPCECHGDCGLDVTRTEVTSSEAAVAYVATMLDWYDEYTGRTPDDYTATPEDVTRAAALIAA